MRLDPIVVNSYGQLIRLDTGMDLTTMTSVSVFNRDPSGNAGDWTTGATKEDGDTSHAESEGKTIVQYRILQNDIDETGDWKLRAKIYDGTYYYYGTPVYLPVETS